MTIPIIDIMELYKKEAFENYLECPKIITAVTHADKTDDSEFHCIWRGIWYDKATKEMRPYSVKKLFIVPKQRVRQFFDRRYGDYVGIKVLPQFPVSLYEGEMFWLFVSVKNPFGFLTPYDSLDLSKYEIVSAVSSLSRPLQTGLMNRSWFLVEDDEIEDDALA